MLLQTMVLTSFLWHHELSLYDTTRQAPIRNDTLDRFIIIDSRRGRETCANYCSFLLAFDPPTKRTRDHLLFTNRANMGVV